LVRNPAVLLYKDMSGLLLNAVFVDIMCKLYIASTNPVNYSDLLY